jgi:hypothetical protein
VVKVGDLISYAWPPGLLYRNVYTGIVLDVMPRKGIRAAADPTLYTFEMVDFDGKRHVFDVWDNAEQPEVLSESR